MVLVAGCSSSNNNTGGGSCDSGLSCSPTVGAGETEAGDIPAEAVGTYTTTYDDFGNTGGPFATGTTATFEVTSDNKLIVSIDGQECIVLENPVYRFGAGEGDGNFTFKDNCENDVAFNLSLNNADNSFNEVNVEPVDSTGFFGQFFE